MLERNDILLTYSKETSSIEKDRILKPNFEVACHPTAYHDKLTVSYYSSLVRL